MALELKENVLTAKPLPLSTTGTKFPALEDVLTFNVAVFAPGIAGVNVTVTAQPSPGAIVATQVELTLYEPSLPTSWAPLKATGAVPVDRIMKVLLVDWLPARTSGNVIWSTPPVFTTIVASEPLNPSRDAD
jgi:hypothetical protein